MAHVLGFATLHPPPATRSQLNVYVARQPIFDRDNRVAGYELLYRNTSEAEHAGGGVPPERMCTETVAHALLDIGLDRLTEGRPAFVNATREFLRDGLFRLFPPRSVVVELLETVEPDEAAIAACAQLVAEGYQLALDDFEYGPEFDPLLELAHIVKLDVLDRDPADVRRAADRVRPFGVRLVAERVETQEAWATCVELGFDLFQGYFFSRPETVPARELPSGLTAAIRLLNLARDPRASDRALEELAASDASLSSKLLRLASSAMLPPRAAGSVGSTVRALGREPLARLAAIVAVAGSARGGGTAAELVRMSLVRARLCELAAEAAGRPGDAGALFMVGLFSKIDALVRAPMTDVVDQIAFTPAVRAALLDGTGPYAPLLAVVDAYERAAWGEAERLAGEAGIAPERVAELYAEALAWMRERMAALSEGARRAD